MRMWLKAISLKTVTNGRKTNLHLCIGKPKSKGIKTWTCFRLNPDSRALNILHVYAAISQKCLNCCRALSVNILPVTANTLVMIRETLTMLLLKCVIKVNNLKEDLNYLKVMFGEDQYKATTSPNGQRGDSLLSTNVYRKASHVWRYFSPNKK